MKKVIHMTLDSASIDAAIRELREYQKRLKQKAEELRKRVAELIRDKAEPVFQAAIADDNFKVIKDGEGESESPKIGGVSVEVKNDGNVSVVVTSGEDAVFMEFGAGVYHNGSVGSSPNPLGAGLGYTIGGFGQGKGAREVWGYRGSDGYIHLTHGVPASMPLYKAVMAVLDDIVKIAQEVFST